MLDFDRMIVSFRKYGGLRLVWQYVKMGLTWLIVKEFCRCIIKRKSLKSMYPAIEMAVAPFLQEKFCSEHSAIDSLYTDISHSDVSETRVWWCWLQGLDNAPSIAKACLESLRRNLPNVTIEVVTNENYSKWVDLPEHVIKKHDKGIIPHALYCDILRLALLAKYGGVWIDSTVLCTGMDNKNVDDAEGQDRLCPSWDEIVNADLFMFQYGQKGSPWNGSISNWFIAAKAGNPLIIHLLEILIKYWKDYNCVLDYFMFHRFFGFISKNYKEMCCAMPYGYSVAALQLGKHFNDEYDKEKFDKFTRRVLFHKLYHQLNEKTINNKANYYNNIIKEYETAN